jgi:two-component system, chemotaxis family, protein-glutamate methylesterase/glutaminase
MKTIRVMIVEDSRVVREHLRRIISADPRFTVAALAESGEEALSSIDRIAPDIITMDIRLPGMQGFDVTRRIMALRPTPIVVVSGIGSEEVNLTMEALKAGALAVVEKPVDAGHQDYDAIASQLRTQLAIMSDVKVVRQRGVRAAAHLERRPASPAATSYRVLGVATSTGGPFALMQLLSGLGSSFPLPIAIVQHMLPAFLDGFAEWLNSVSPLPVEIVNATLPTKAGRVYLAAGDRHLKVEGSFVLPDESPPVGGHRPAADLLFSSIARTVGAAGIGVLLTGMGEDGAGGLQELRAAGGLTFAEDESSAVVYSMPAAAVRLGAVCESLPLTEIAGRLCEIVELRPGAN